MKSTFTLLLVFCTAFLPYRLMAAPNVVTSIQPIHLITRSIMAGIAEPKRVVGRNSSAHHFQFKPSQLRLIQRADLMIWIDSRFESGFQHLDDQLPASTTRLELLPAIEPDNDDAHSDHADEGHEHEEFNGHIWLSPSHVIKSINLISQALIQLDPDNQAKYQRNASSLSAEVSNWFNNAKDNISNQQLAYLLEHDFLHHFEADFDIQAVAVLRDAHDHNKSLREHLKLEDMLGSHSAQCILVEHIPASRLALQIAEQHKLQIIGVDIMGWNLPQTPATIVGILHSVSRALSRCQHTT